MNMHCPHWRWMPFRLEGPPPSNLAAAAIAMLLLRRHRGPHAPGGSFFGCLRQSTCSRQLDIPCISELRTSAIGRISCELSSLPGSGAVLLASTGALSYWFASHWAMNRLGQRLEGTHNGVWSAYSYTLVSYIAMSALAIIAGLSEPDSAFLILMSARLLFLPRPTFWRGGVHPTHSGECPGPADAAVGPVQVVVRTISDAREPATATAHQSFALPVLVPIERQQNRSDSAYSFGYLSAPRPLSMLFH